MEKIIEMVQEILFVAMNSGKTIEMDLTNRQSSAFGSLSQSESETLHIFISSQSPYSLVDNDEPEEGE